MIYGMKKAFVWGIFFFFFFKKKHDNRRNSVTIASQNFGVIGLQKQKYYGMTSISAIAAAWAVWQKSFIGRGDALTIFPR